MLTLNTAKNVKKLEETVFVLFFCFFGGGRKTVTRRCLENIFTVGNWPKFIHYIIINGNWPNNIQNNNGNQPYKMSISFITLLGAVDSDQDCQCYERPCLICLYSLE